MHKVFVYGSLLSGMGNHGLLSDSKKLGDTKSPEGFDMLDLGYFPGIVKGEGKVMGEVYEVDDNTLIRLNRLEGYREMAPESGLYNRMEIDTEFGKAFVYVYNNHYGRSPQAIVENGDWRTHYNKKLKR